MRPEVTQLTPTPVCSPAIRWRRSDDGWEQTPAAADAQGRQALHEPEEQNRHNDGAVAFHLPDTDPNDECQIFDLERPEKAFKKKAWAMEKMLLKVRKKELKNIVESDASRRDLTIMRTLAYQIDESVARGVDDEGVTSNVCANASHVDSVSLSLS